MIFDGKTKRPPVEDEFIFRVHVGLSILACISSHDSVTSTPHDAWNASLYLCSFLFISFCE